MVAIEGHFDGKVFVPDQPVDLPRDRALILHIEEVEVQSTWSNSQNLWSFLDKHAGSIQAPQDWSTEHDHYIHGTPKSDKP